MPRALWSDPYAAESISLLQDPARARAAAVEKIGEVQARAAEVSGNANANAQLQGGNAWAGAINNIGQTVAAIPGQIQQAHQQSRQAAMQNLQLSQMQRQETAQQQLAATKQQLSAMMQSPDVYGEDGTINVKSLLSKMGGPLPNGDAGPTRAPDAATVYSLVDPINESLLKARASANTATQHRNDVVGRMADTIIQFGGNYLDNVKLGTGALIKAGVITPNQADEILAPMLANQDSIPAILTHLKTLATPLKPVILKPGDVGFNENTNQPIPGMSVPEKPEKPTEASLALDLSSPDPAVRARATTAMAALKPPPPPRPLQEQMLEAITKGDKVTVERISSTLRAEAQARQDPATAALAFQMKNLSVQEAQARLDKLKEQNQPLDVNADIRTTSSGAKYVDLSQYSGNERNKARQAASAAGAVPVSKEQADSLTTIDEARADQRAIMSQIQSLLPTSAAGRPGAYVSTKLSKLFQTNDQVAAFGTMQSAAIKTMRALAGSKGLRMSTQLIDRSIQNDIPQLTDTLGVAQQKLKNIEMLLTNAEQPIVVMNRSVPVQPSGPEQAPALTPGLQGLQSR